MFSAPGSAVANTQSKLYVFLTQFRLCSYGRLHICQFKFFDPTGDDHCWGPALGEDTPLATASYYTDPFYAECRAYGRIRAAKGTQLKAIAVPCHGYLFLRRKDKEELERHGIDFGHVNLAYQRSTIGGLRVRAIVKDIGSSNSGVTSTTARRILGRVVSMNKEGIYNMDIRIDNFRDGKLVDFGSSWTEPHALLDFCPPHAALERKMADRVMFEQMAEDEEIKTRGKLGMTVKALHDMTLRSHTVQ
ncbi:hypothetical protein AU210_016354 [Fusarium oxysporum f. sp. radicis-cucumerinum]|uniref:Uncharacterized protein n=1 Tax=Fusarium oxysporum f. sp. radicis-cucumerinum TaxID=327505 RepID=A0A2H3G8H7_FUSOX|nr:hypothetical protein AU210_016354 [Fusarium oxysporum f. sp. radicis-cucumerinum]